MPLVNVKLYEGRLDENRERELIEQITDAVTRVLGDQVREHTWVVLQEVAPRRWGIGGKQGSL